MTRPWQIWTAFAACASVALAAMGWLTVHTLEVDRQLTAAHAEADLEQSISLALWRMDTKLAPMIAEEVARPPEFFTFWRDLPIPEANSRENNILPLEMPTNGKNVYLNFEVTADEQWFSPQVPQKGQERLASASGLTSEELAARQQQFSFLCSSVKCNDLIDQLPEQTLPGATTWQQPREANPFYLGNAVPLAVEPQAIPEKVVSLFKGKLKGKGDNNLQARNRRYQDEAQQALQSQRAGAFGEQQQGFVAPPNAPVQEEQSGGLYQQIAKPPTVESVSRPLWMDDKLLLARRVSRGGQLAVQGSWIDWPNLKKELLEEAQEELPTADLKPVHNLNGEQPQHMLAGLPVQLVVAPASLSTSASPSIRWALSLGWLALLIAVVAVALLLWGVVELSERRASFVSSVTHELRSPLTTFRMYADMLSRGMVPDAERRQEYLETLHREAQRLSHLVENVLSYARLERGRGLSSREELSVADLTNRLETRLSERATQSTMEFDLQLSEEVGSQQLITDVGMVEQILFNLVDNACKYASEATERTIQCQVEATAQHVTFSVCDHGPGFECTRQANRPQPFSKSSEEAAVTAPGVGLGLALCSRLAQQLGGHLDIGGTSAGAVVTLQLPLAKSKR